MLILWRVRYVDREDRGFKDRDLFLDTSTLPPAMRAAIELQAERSGTEGKREFLKFRSMFREEQPADLGIACSNAEGGMTSFAIPDYFEDEACNEISLAELGPILTGSADTILVPGGARQHVIDYMLSPPTPVPFDVTLTEDDSRLLGYFVRDFEELRNSALMKEGAGSISSGGNLPALPNGDYHHVTAVSDDEIRSYLTIFRRLYMANEPANFVKAVAAFERVLGTHPLAKWVRGVCNEYEALLSGVPGFCQRRSDMAISFSVKRLIDVFLYTQYAHQPDNGRQRQFVECLQQVGGRRNFLIWQFLTEVWGCGIEIQNAGRVIAWWFKRYCDLHNVSPDVLTSIHIEHTGFGSAEKSEARQARLFREKVEELELALWKNAGRPEGGPVQFRLLAQEQLKQALNGDQRAT